MKITAKDLRKAKERQRELKRSGKTVKWFKPKFSLKVIVFAVIFFFIASALTICACLALPAVSSVMAGVIGIDAQSEGFIIFTWGFVGVLIALFFYKFTTKILKSIWTGLVRKPYLIYAKERDEINEQIAKEYSDDNKKD